MMFCIEKEKSSSPSGLKVSEVFIMMPGTIVEKDIEMQLAGSENTEATLKTTASNGLADSTVDDESGTFDNDEFTQEILRAIREVFGADDAREAPDAPPEDRLYHVKHNTTKHFRVCRWRGARVPRWKDLELEYSVELQSVELRIGDLIVVVVSGQADAVAEIAEIRAVGDGRHVLRVFWFLDRDSVLPKLDDIERTEFPTEFAYVKAAYTQVILWTTTRTLLDDLFKAKVLPNRILCYRDDGTLFLRPHTAPEVRWTQNRCAGGKTG
ncbi:hypothetical protein B0J12DRAFT_687337 [Macrophomina phaseolina]|uniref:BAH domain-containing protein n=1 Tax=Macrophomina phaseolina TaxID=35725 RepID=A0ABQ8FSB3_9PEZI|nr:hypothetical protein B0J12DRAFT_687337 [Macrophomina phaseolina]